jgi:hypothetical protein
VKDLHEQSGNAREQLRFLNGSTYAVAGQVSFSSSELPYGLVADSSTNSYYVSISDNGKKGAVGVVSGP